MLKPLKNFHYYRIVFCLALMLILLNHGSFALAAKKLEQPSQTLSDVQQRLESLKKELGNSQEAHKDAADALKESEVAISVSNKKLYEINFQQQQNKKLYGVCR